MIHTLGDTELVLTKHYPSADHDILDEIVNLRYKTCLRAGGYVWSRLEIDDYPIPMIANYITGTITATNGSTAIVGDGTTAWNSGQDQLSIRIAGRDEFYTFNFVDANDANLDHGYEGPSGSGLSYSIFKRIYTLPVDVQEIRRIIVPQVNHSLQRWSRAELDIAAPSRIETSYPRVWVPYSDTTDGRLQIELYPTPNTAIGPLGLLMDYKTARPELRQYNDPIPAWFPWDALVIGCKVDLSVQATSIVNRMTGIWAARQEQVNQQMFQAALDAAISEDINARPPEQLMMDQRLNAHRRARQFSDRSYHWWELHISNQ